MNQNNQTTENKQNGATSEEKRYVLFQPFLKI